MPKEQSTGSNLLNYPVAWILVFVSDFIVLKYLYDRRDGDMIHIETFSDATIDSSSFESAVTRLNAIGAVLVEAMADVGDSIHLGRHTKNYQFRG